MTYVPTVPLQVIRYWLHAHLNHLVLFCWRLEINICPPEENTNMKVTCQWLLCSVTKLFYKRVVFCTVSNYRLLGWQYIHNVKFATDDDEDDDG